MLRGAPSIVDAELTAPRAPCSFSELLRGSFQPLLRLMRYVAFRVRGECAEGACVPEVLCRGRVPRECAGDALPGGSVPGVCPELEECAGECAKGVRQVYLVPDIAAHEGRQF